MTRQVPEVSPRCRSTPLDGVVTGLQGGPVGSHVRQPGPVQLVLRDALSELGDGTLSGGGLRVRWACRPRCWGAGALPRLHAERWSWPQRFGRRILGEDAAQALDDAPRASQEDGPDEEDGGTPADASAG